VNTADHSRAQIRVMQLSLGIGILMLFMKCYAWWITRSAAIFSDAAESVVHNVAVVFALFSVWYSSKPADQSHHYGHSKIDYFSAGFEGSLIVLAAIYIIYESVHKWMFGLAIENLGSGIWFTVAAFLINGGLGGYLVWRGRKTGSLIVEANGKHVLTDSWTSLGVVVGLVLTQWTGWLPLDPIFAILVATNILWSGFDLMRRSFRGLMDEADPAVEVELRKVLDEEIAHHHVQYHGLRHRTVGRTIWVEVHLLFPDETPLQLAHAQATAIEEALERRMGAQVQVTTHLEPLADHARIHRDAPSK
jgi:cation diffusion facilitator family transporter